MNREQFLRIWRNAQKPTEATLCPVAQEFKDKLEDVIFHPLSSVRVNRPHLTQAKYMLQEEYHTWKKSAGPDHQECLSEVYDEAYDRLHLLELTHRPEPNVIIDYDELTRPAPPPAPAPPPVVKGIIIGHDEGLDRTE